MAGMLPHESCSATHVRLPVGFGAVCTCRCVCAPVARGAAVAKRSECLCVRCLQVALGERLESNDDVVRHASAFAKLHSL